MPSHKQQLIYLLAALGLVCLGGAAGWWLHSAPQSRVLREEGYEFIRPVLLCNVDSLPQNEDRGLSGALSQVVSAHKEMDIGVYYLNPTAGKWACVNENGSFSPASMLKVPIMAAILRTAELTPGLLDKRVYWDGRQDDNQGESIRPVVPLAPGSHTLTELIDSMVKYSDNNATRLLHDRLSAEEFADIYTDLGLSAPAVGGPVDFMSPKTFTLFLRVLYNGTYLSRGDSERALKEMSESSFLPGLRAGVPAGTPVAEKFGERSSAQGPQELHDCGVVYPKGDAYFLCIMTRGADESALAAAISRISKLVYEHVTR